MRRIERRNKDFAAIFCQGKRKGTGDRGFAYASLPKEEYSIAHKNSLVYFEHTGQYTKRILRKIRPGQKYD